MAPLPPKDSGAYPEDLELTLLQIVHRHGERTPVRKRLEKLFPAVWNMCDANAQMFATIVTQQQTMDFVPLQRLVDGEEAPNKKQVTFEPGACYYGQLTTLGRKSLAALGARLREIYVDRLKFLPEIFDDKTVYIRSTDYTRTMESVQQLIAGGLYPQGKRGDDFTLKIRTRDHRVENLFPNPNCYRLRQLAKESRQEVAELCKDKFASLSERLKNYVDSVSLDSHPSANGILDTLVAAEAHGFKLPADIDDQVLRDLEDTVVLEWFHGAMTNHEQRRLTMGSLAGDIRNRMVERADGTDSKTGGNERKLYIYSGHDTTVAPMLIILGAYDKRWPPFGSAIIFELFKQKKNENKSFWASLFGSEKTEHYVRVRYNDKILELPGCAAQGDHHVNGDKTLCTLEAFKKIVKDVVPDNWAEECRAK